MSARDRIRQRLAMSGPATVDGLAAALDIPRRRVRDAIWQMFDVRSADGLLWVHEFPPYPVVHGPFDPRQDAVDEMWECYAR